MAWSSLTNKRYLFQSFIRTQNVWRRSRITWILSLFYLLNLWTTCTTISYTVNIKIGWYWSEIPLRAEYRCLTYTMAMILVYEIIVKGWCVLDEGITCWEEYRSSWRIRWKCLTTVTYLLKVLFLKRFWCWYD